MFWSIRQIAMLALGALSALPCAAQHIAFSSFLGGNHTDRAHDLAVAADGSVVIVGQTESSDFATPGGVQQSKGDGIEGFVSRINAANQRVYGTYLGGVGSGDEIAYGVATDASGRIYVTGSRLKDGDTQCFLVRLNPAVNGPAQLEYSRVFGGSAEDVCVDVTVDAANRAYVTGYTHSANYPTLNPIHAHGGGREVILTRFDANGTIDYSTFLGGNGYDQSGDEIAVQGAWIHIVGSTQVAATGDDAFVIRLNADGDFSDPGEFSVRISGSDRDQGFGLDLDASGNIYATGLTYSADLPTTGGVIGPSYPGGGACWVGRVSNTGVVDRLSYVPTSGYVCTDVAVGANKVWLAGSHGSQARVTRTSLNLDALDLGFDIQPDVYGAWSDAASAIGVRSNGHAVITGETLSSGYPVTPDAFQTSHVVADGFFTELGAEMPVLSLVDCSVTETNAGYVPCTMRAELDRAAVAPVNFVWDTASGGTATHGVDFVSTSGGGGPGAQIHPGRRSYTLPVDVIGDNVDENDEYGRVLLSQASGPVSFSDFEARLTIVDDDAAPTLSIADVSLIEGSGSAALATFNLTLSATSERTISLQWATANETAVAPGDYAAGSGTLTIAAGAAGTTITRPIVADTMDEADESFLINLTSPVNVAIADAQGRGVIVDDDDAPTLSVDNGGCSVSEGNAGSVNCAFVLRLSAASGKIVGFSTATTAGSASAGADFTGHASTARSIAAGQTTLTVNVAVLADVLDEDNESFALNITGVQNATPGALTATGTITDDDNPPALGIDNSGCSVSEGNAGSVNCAFVLRLSAASSKIVSFSTATTAGSASAGADFTGHASSARSIAAGQTTLTVNVAVLGDVLDEDNESFTLNITGVQNATPGALTATGTITDDDNPPALGIDNSGCSVLEGDSGSINCAFVLRLSAASGKTVSFNTATANGTASAGSDYTAHASAARSITAGQSLLTVNVPVLGETIEEDDETFTLTVSTVQNATPATLSGNGLILSDDLAELVFFDGFE